MGFCDMLYPVLDRFTGKGHQLPLNIILLPPPPPVDAFNVKSDITQMLLALILPVAWPVKVAAGIVSYTTALSTVPRAVAPTPLICKLLKTSLV
jgi:hypothetical protein